MTAPKALKAKRFERIDGIPFNAPFEHTLTQKPEKVAFILDSDLFEKSGHILTHNQTVFMEDHGHDWHWNGDTIKYFPRVGTGQCSILVLYEVEEVSLSQEQAALLYGPAKFDIFTGKRIAPDVIQPS